MGTSVPVPICRFNLGVECNKKGEHRCDNCGWNPIVEAQRKARGRNKVLVWSKELKKKKSEETENETEALRLKIDVLRRERDDCRAEISRLRLEMSKLLEERNHLKALSEQAMPQIREMTRKLVEYEEKEKKWQKSVS